MEMKDKNITILGFMQSSHNFTFRVQTGGTRTKALKT